jgi:hypothetical protein
VQPVAARAHRLESSRVVGQAVRHQPQVSFDVADLGLGGAQARFEVGERRAAGELRDRRAERVERGTFERGVRPREGLAVCDGIGEQLFLSGQCRSLFIFVIGSQVIE